MLFLLGSPLTSIGRKSIINVWHRRWSAVLKSGLGRLPERNKIRRRKGMKYNAEPVAKSPRIPALIDDLYKRLPEIEADRAVLLTESYK